MATPKSQRIGIFIIAVVMVVGTIGSFLVMMFSYDNQAAETLKAQEEQARIQKVYKEYQEKVAAQGKELSKKHYPVFKKYESYPGKFDASSVSKVTTRDLKKGTGDKVTKDTKYSAYYIGWNPKGKVFDGSIQDGSLRSPIAGGNLITGWNEGVIGMNLGGIREIAIPSEKAYGEKGSGDDIPPNTPIKFVVYVIPQVEQIPIPQFNTTGVN